MGVAARPSETGPQLIFSSAFDHHHRGAMIDTSIVGFVLLTILAIAFLRRLTWVKRFPNTRSPPGPAPLAIIGNIHQFPRSKPYVEWREWGKARSCLSDLFIYTNIILAQRNMGLSSKSEFYRSLCLSSILIKSQRIYSRRGDSNTLVVRSCR